MTIHKPKKNALIPKRERNEFVSYFPHLFFFLTSYIFPVQRKKIKNKK